MLDHSLVGSSLGDCGILFGGSGSLGQSSSLLGVSLIESLLSLFLSLSGLLLACSLRVSLGCLGSDLLLLLSGFHDGSSLLSGRSVRVGSFSLSISLGNLCLDGSSSLLLVGLLLSLGLLGLSLLRVGLLLC